MDHLGMGINEDGGKADVDAGFLTRLRRDRRGNTLVIMTAAMIPLIGMVGGGVDLSRMYILKTRLQHACDSGALAGRKAMGSGTWAFSDYAARRQADMFFDGNFATGSYGSRSLVRTFTENAGRVSGTATATIPMTLMRVFGRTDETISVACSSEMRLPNTDIMFVLDTTGSMAQAQPGDNVSKLDALKTSVKCFYEIVARLDTNATCSTGVPAGGTGEQVQIRFGFVPYATNVNVGRLLPTRFLADSWTYQTREAMWNQGPPTYAWNEVGVQPLYSGRQSRRGVAQNQCNRETAQQNGIISRTGDTYQNDDNRTYESTDVTDFQWTSPDGGTCSGIVTQRRHSERRTTTPGERTFAGWRYAPLPVNTSLLKDGTSWRSSFTWPVGTNGSDRQIDWNGCIEERQTVRATNYDPIPAGANDLNIDMVPQSGDAATLWAPALSQLIFARRVQTNWNQLDITVRETTEDYYNNVPSYCPTEGRKLQRWPDANAFSNYVDTLQAQGNTYHDIGLIWGARLASPTGIFAAENARTDRGGDIERHIIFMTDGDACTSPQNYGPYGMDWLDRRTTNAQTAPTGGCTSNNFTLTEQVNRRTEALCNDIRNRNFTLWVIAFGSLANETETRLRTCATPGRYFQATNAASLQATFKAIADQISMLRLTQ